ncbi:MAG: polyprenyl synthetase family protein [Elusimicrobia bacterium]|nr:polyprenyl synthetase family protein [Candidatus Liberimonas magnetica]
MNLKQYLTGQTNTINKALHKYLPHDNSRIARSMRYSIFAGGKRLRPILVLEGTKICGGSIKRAMPAACAVEFVHTYSLIHDDLPSMDNDDLRRGMPTSHKKFDEATAILTGDALLTDAFRILARTNAEPETIVKIIDMLAVASGYKGMIGGQVKDTLEAGNWKNESKKQAINNLIYMHETKTAALIVSSLLIGASLSKADKQDMNALRDYGRCIGLAFQICDDVLDITADKKTLGKKGSDLKNNKLTYPALFGLERSREMAAKLVLKAKIRIKLFGKKSKILEQLADYIVERKY